MSVVNNVDVRHVLMYDSEGSLLVSSFISFFVAEREREREFSYMKSLTFSHLRHILHREPLAEERDLVSSLPV